MSEIQYLRCDTGGNRIIQGCSRVYFCSHPDDVERYYHDIVKDIRSVCDCIVYSKWDDEEADLNDLVQMQLFVVPVTARFLFEENRAREVEIPFAVKNHIPVLPLLEDAELVDAFNEYSNGLQYLMRDDEDSTAIPYKTKLNNYLKQVLYGNLIVQAIKESFSQFIFMSYRKKDRSKANQLMRMIHEHPNFWDSAIWYDEFLVPGERFEPRILDELKQSNYFALVVTPNLINENNYVLQCELPKAQEFEKKIIAIEMEPTNLTFVDMLSEDAKRCLEKLSECVPKDQLTNYLTRTVQEDCTSLKIEAHDQYLHLYYMGLAYLGGVYTDVNRDRGFSLILQAAKSGLVEAIKKIADMYSTGDSVQLDYYKAIEWREKAVQYYREQSTAKDDLYKQLLELGRLHEMIYDFDAAESVYLDVLQSLNEGNTETPETWYHEYAYDRLGRINHSQGKLEESIAWYQRALRRRKTYIDRVQSMIAELPLSLELRDKYLTLVDESDYQALYEYYDKLGNLVQEFGDWEAAENYYRERVTYSEGRYTVVKLISEFLGDSFGTEKNESKVKRDADFCNICLDFSAGYRNLGNLAREQGKYDEAEEWYHRALEWDERLIPDVCGDADRYRQLMTDFDRLGAVAYLREEYDVAENMYQMAFEQCKAIQSLAEDSNALLLIADHYALFGDVAKGREEYEKAEYYYQEGLSSIKSILDKGDSLSMELSLSVCYENLGDLALERYKFDRAEQWYQRSYEIIERLSTHMKTHSILMRLVNLCSNFAYLDRLHNRMEKAEAWTQKMTEVCRELSGKSKSLDNSRALANVFRGIGTNSVLRGDWEDAIEWFLKGQNILEDILAKSESYSILYDLSHCYENLADASAHIDRWENIQHWYQDYLDMEEIRAKKFRTEQSGLELAKAYRDCAKIAIDHNSWNQAKVWYQRSFLLREDYLQKTKSQDVFEDLIDDYRKMIDHFTAEKLQAEEYLDLWYQQCIDVLESYSDPTIDFDLFTTTIYFYACYGSNLRTAGRWESAYTWETKRMVLIESLAVGSEEQKNQELLRSYGNLGCISEALGNREEAKGWYQQAVALSSQNLEQFNYYYWNNIKSLWSLTRELKYLFKMAHFLIGVITGRENKSR